jgi:hypothetical protein
MAPSPLPLSKKKEGDRADAILEYSSKGFALGRGRLTMRGDGDPCKNEGDEEMVGSMDGHVLREQRESTIPHRRDFRLGWVLTA